MFYYLNRLYQLYKENDFMFFIYLSLAFFLIVFIYNWIRRKRGTWTNKAIDYSKFVAVNNRNANMMLDANDYGQPRRRAPPTVSKGELECRRVIEEIFRKSFPKCRPDFLRNSVTSDDYNNINLEIDCYNHELKIGVEYNGIQHYKYIPFFHKNKEAFYNQKYRDEMKKTKCQQNGIFLIEVPYTVKVEDIESYIRNELKKKLGLNV